MTKMNKRTNLSMGACVDIWGHVVELFQWKANTGCITPPSHHHHHHHHQQEHQQGPILHFFSNVTRPSLSLTGVTRKQVGKFQSKNFGEIKLSSDDEGADKKATLASELFSSWDTAAGHQLQFTLWDFGLSCTPDICDKYQVSSELHIAHRLSHLNPTWLSGIKVWRGRILLLRPRVLFVTKMWVGAVPQSASSDCPDSSSQNEIWCALPVSWSLGIIRLSLWDAFEWGGSSFFRRLSRLELVGLCRSLVGFAR